MPDTASVKQRRSLNGHTCDDRGEGLAQKPSGLANMTVTVSSRAKTSRRGTIDDSLSVKSSTEKSGPEFERAVVGDTLQ
jgi:hypothetical protein